MDLFFLRHASAGDPDPRQDYDERRALNDAGIEQCSLAAFALESFGAELECIYSSPLRRSWQTAEIVAAHLGLGKLIQRADSLAPLGTYQGFLQLLEECGDREAVLFVGHNSNLREYMGKLLGSGLPAALHLKKGGLAKLRRDDRRTVLQWCVTPKLLRTLAPTAAYRALPDLSARRNGNRRASTSARPRSWPRSRAKVKA